MGWYNLFMKTDRNPIFERVNPRMLVAEPVQRCDLAECRGACCVFGVWVDLREVDDIMRNASLIQPHLPEADRNPGEWFAAVEDKDMKSPSGTVMHTAVNNQPDHYGRTACIFCLSDGKCALQVAAVHNGLHPWRFKPYYCILHPLDLDDKGRITLDRADEMVEEPGSCLRPSDRSIPLVETFTPELRYLFGEKGYAQLVKLSRQAAGKETNEPSQIVLKAVTDAEREQVKQLITRDWGAPEIVVNGQVYTPHTLHSMFALIDDSMAGLITWKITDSECEIVSLNAYHRGAGVGSALLAAVEELAAAQGCRTCSLVTTNDNLHAIRFYQSRGYRVMEIRKNAVNRAREIKPSIPLVAENGIPIRDEVILKKRL